MFAAMDLDAYCVQIPSRAWLRSESAKVAGDEAPKLQKPATDSFVLSIDTTFGQHFLHIAERQGKAAYSQTACMMTGGRKRWRLNEIGFIALA